MDPLKNNGLVHNMPTSIHFSSFGSYVHTAYSKTSFARNYKVIASLGIPCVIGKSILFRKSHIDNMGGLEKFGKYLAEDDAIAKSFHNNGQKIILSPDLVFESVKEYKIKDYFLRQVRWARVRTELNYLLTRFEPFSECIVNAIAGSFFCKYFFGFSPSKFVCWQCFLWFISDMTMAYLVLKKHSGFLKFDIFKFLLAWLVRELSALPVYIWSSFGNSIVWRGKTIVL
jgi:ceramide glucosyltransferase